MYFGNPTLVLICPSSRMKGFEKLFRWSEKKRTEAREAQQIDKKKRFRQLNVLNITREEKFMNFVASRIETIDFKAFMKKEHQENNRIPKKQTHFFSFIPLNPLAFIDPVFLGIAAGILAIALLERSLAGNGHVAFAEAIYTFLRFAFPIIGFVALYFLLGQLRF